MILVTGQPGIAVKRCVKRLADGVSRAPAPLNVEERMVHVYKQADPRMGARSDREALVAILQLPTYVQRDLWRKGLGGVLDELGADGRLRFVSFHATFYHQKKLELVSPVHLTALRPLSGRAQMVIMLIDDCYDIYRRLLAKGEMFHEGVMAAGVSKQEAMVRSLCNLFTILAWREAEAMASRLIADTLGVPLVILAVKHARMVAERLVARGTAGSRLFYVAHPIAQVRRATAVRPPGLPGQLSNFVERTMRQYDDLVLFIPDTIDEARIRTDSDRYLIPELGEPWSIPFSGDDWLFEPLAPELAQINPLNPKGFRHSASKAARSQLSAMLSILSQKVRSQIVARDHSLVEQALDGIVLFQPYYEGHVPGGVLREARYNYDLITTFGQQRRKAYILDAEDNLGKYRIQNLWDVLLNTAIDRSGVGSAQETAVDKLVSEWKRDPARVLSFLQGSWSLDEVKAAARQLLGDTYRFDSQFAPADSSTLRGGDLGEAADRLQRGWAVIDESARRADPFRALCPEPENQYVVVPVRDFDQAAVSAMAGP